MTLSIHDLAVSKSNTGKKNSKNLFLQNLFFIACLCLMSARGFADTPANGVTDFNSYSGFVDLTGVKSAGATGLKATNVKGYDFTLFSLNNNADCGIGIEPFTGQTPMVYGYSNSGISLVNALEVSSNGLTYFDLNAVDISMDNGALTARSVTLTGYKGGSAVPGATLTITLQAASKGALLTTFTVSTNSAFKGIDRFRISVPGTDVGAIGVDNINAVNFTSAPLPLTLVSFTGKSVNTGIQLSWNTDNEINTQSFEVQKANGIVFSSVGKVAAGNAATGNSYTYEDQFPQSAGNYFYRLKIKDRDGKVTYSPVINIKFNTATKGYSLFPNPLTGDQLHIKLPASQAGSLRVSIATMNGKVVDKKIIHIEGLSTDHFTLWVKTLPAGIYQLQLTEMKTGYTTYLQFVK